MVNEKHKAKPERVRPVKGRKETKSEEKGLLTTPKREIVWRRNWRIPELN